MNNSPELALNNKLAFNIIDNSKKMPVPVGVLSTALKGINTETKQGILKLIPNDVLVALYNAHPNELPLIVEDMDQEKLTAFLADFLKSKSVDECVMILHFCYGIITTNIANLCDQIPLEAFCKHALSSNKLNLTLFVFFFQKLNESDKDDLMSRIEIDRLRTILLDPFFHKMQDIDDFDELIGVLNYIPKKNWSLIVNNEDVYSQLANIGLSDYLQENLESRSKDGASSCGALENISPSVFFSFLTCPTVKKMVAVGLVIGLAGLLSVAAIGVLGAIGMVAITPAASLIPALIMVGIGFLSLMPPALLCAKGSESIPRYGLNGYFFATSQSIARVDSSPENISLNGLNL